MEAMVQKISAALGVQQREEDQDEDINLPLKPSRRGAQDGSRGGAGREAATSPLVGTAMTVCLVTFALLFGAFMAFSAQAAWTADGFSGLARAAKRDVLSEDGGRCSTRSTVTAERDMRGEGTKTRMGGATSGGTATTRPRWNARNVRRSGASAGNSQRTTRIPKRWRRRAWTRRMSRT
jgi:hypothetical protein